MKIPNRIKIGEHFYDIKKVRLIGWNDTIVGQIHYGNKRIKIRMSNKDMRDNEDTFFHEVAHGLLKELEFNNPSIVKFRNDECFVQEMGLLLRKTFLDLLKSQEQGDLRG